MIDIETLRMRGRKVGPPPCSCCGTGEAVVSVWLRDDCIPVTHPKFPMLCEFCLAYRTDEAFWGVFLACGGFTEEVPAYSIEYTGRGLTIEQVLKKLDEWKGGEPAREHTT